MKKLLTAVVVSAIAGSAIAQDLSLSADMTYTSKYVFRGVKVTEQSIQPSVELSTGDFYAGVWSNQPIKSGEDNEFDFYAGFGIPVNETIKLDVGATYYYYPDSDSGATFEPYIGVTGEIMGLSAGLYLYRDIDVKAWTTQGNLGYSFPIEAAGVSLDLGAYYGNVDGRNESYRYYGVDLSVPFQINENAVVTVGVHYGDTLGLGGSRRLGLDDNLWWTAALTLGF
jgi:uncharacterized protein (TIGR02001 family)